MNVLCAKSMFTSVQIMMDSSYCIENLNSKANNDVFMHNLIGPVDPEVCKQLCSEDGDKNAENKNITQVVFFYLVLCFFLFLFSVFLYFFRKKSQIPKSIPKVLKVFDDLQCMFQSVTDHKETSYHTH